MWRVICDKEDAPNTLYDEKGKADRVAKMHNRRGHNAHVERVSVVITVEERYSV